MSLDSQVALASLNAQEIPYVVAYARQKHEAFENSLKEQVEGGWLSYEMGDQDAGEKVQRFSGRK